MLSLAQVFQIYDCWRNYSAKNICVAYSEQLEHLIL